MIADSKIEAFEALRAGYGSIVTLTIRHAPPPAMGQSLTLELLNGDRTASMTFTGVRDLRLEDIGPGRICVLEIVSVVQDQWERIRYRVFNAEQGITLAFYCADFEFSA
jgi:hypothetical protein